MLSLGDCYGVSLAGAAGRVAAVGDTKGERVAAGTRRRAGQGGGWGARGERQSGRQRACAHVPRIGAGSAARDHVPGVCHSGLAVGEAGRGDLERLGENDLECARRRPGGRVGHLRGEGVGARSVGRRAADRAGGGVQAEAGGQAARGDREGVRWSTAGGRQAVRVRDSAGSVAERGRGEAERRENRQRVSLAGAADRVAAVGGTEGEAVGAARRRRAGQGGARAALRKAHARRQSARAHAPGVGRRPARCRHGLTVCLAGLPTREARRGDLERLGENDLQRLVAVADAASVTFAVKE